MALVATNSWTRRQTTTAMRLRIHPRTSRPPTPRSRYTPSTSTPSHIYSTTTRDLHICSAGQDGARGTADFDSGQTIKISCSKSSEEFFADYGDKSLLYLTSQGIDAVRQETFLTRSKKNCIKLNIE